MAWTEIMRCQYRREGLRYASDTTDEEWAVIEPHLPPPAMCGHKRATSPCDVVNSIF
jgi:transposase